MTTISDPISSNRKPAFHAPGRPPTRLWTGEEFDRLVDLGAFDGQRIELINGELLEGVDMNDPHAQAVRLAQYTLLSLFPLPEFTVSVQCPMRLASGSRPLPDVIVVQGTPREIREHPSTALLVIEISDTTLEFDRIEKAELYARNGLPEYWIVNLPGRCVEVHRQPLAGEPAARYGQVRVFQSDEKIAPLSKPEVPIAVGDLLP